MSIECVCQDSSFHIWAHPDIVGLSNTVYCFLSTPFPSVTARAVIFLTSFCTLFSNICQLLLFSCSVYPFLYYFLFFVYVFFFFIFLYLWYSLLHHQPFANIWFYGRNVSKKQDDNSCCSFFIYCKNYIGKVLSMEWHFDIVIVVVIIFVVVVVCFGCCWP